VMTRCFPILLLSIASLLGACAGPTPQQATGPLSVRGTIRGLEHPETARIAIYRVTPFGVVERLPGADADVDADGRFESEMLNPDLYIFALRAPGHPVSIVRVPIPPAPPVTLVARKALGLGPASLEIRRAPGSEGPLRLLLSRVEEGVPVVDRRPVTVTDSVSLIDGLTPGRWSVDVLGTGATTEIEIPKTAKLLTLTLRAPQLNAGAEMKGRVLRNDGEPASGLAVTVRMLAPDGSATESWGRYALTNSDGGYHLIGLPAGRALLRVESRDAVYWRLPGAEVVTIPPSGRLDRSFVVDP